MNTEQKQRFFASYWGCNYRFKGTPNCFIINEDSFPIDSDAILPLTHPSKITDVHCVELFDLLWGYLYTEHKNDKEKIDCVKALIDGKDRLWPNQSEKYISFLRNHAYIFQFEGMSIEQLVKSGEVELKN